MTLSWIDDLIIVVYFIFVLGMGAFLKSRMKNSGDFLMAGRSIPLWITALAFISANLGAQEVIGMAASGAKYGIMTAHFYWVGAIPAMLFLGVFMMPFYYGSRARSVPEYLALRFDEKTRAFNSISFGLMTIFSSGISLYALAILFSALLGWSFDLSVLLSAGIVMLYIFMGGLMGAVYNEVLQFFLILLGIAPLVYAGLHHFGGWTELTHHLPEPMTHTWKYMDSPDKNLMGVGLWNLLFGLGFVLSFGYWCTDFLVVQRAMIARNMASAQKTPIVAAFPKMLIPFIVILPGLIAMAMTQEGGSYHLPLKADGRTDFDMTLPTLLSHYYPSGLLGVGLTALLASFMSGMAGNVTAFNSVWTYDIYQAYFNKNASDTHYLKVARFTTIIGVLASISTAYLARSFNNIMDLLQLVFGFVNAPLFATFLLGMFWKRTTANGAFFGLLSGTLAAALTQGLTLAEGKGAWLMKPPLYSFTSSMGQAFAVSIAAWVSCFTITFCLSLVTQKKSDSEMRGLVYSLTDLAHYQHEKWYFRPTTLAFFALILLLFINILLR